MIREYRIEYENSENLFLRVEGNLIGKCCLTAQLSEHSCDAGTVLQIR